LPASKEPDSENPRYTHGVHPKRQNPNAVTIYVPQVSRAMVEEARLALAADGSSLSAFLLELLGKWWEKHKPGNPQVDLDRYGIDMAEGPGPGIPGSCCYHDERGNAKWCWMWQLPRGSLAVVRKDGSQVWVPLKALD